MTTKETPIFDAATVILVRDNNAGDFSVYLMKRSRKHDFMASAYVFPGGRVDAADCDRRLSEFTADFDAAAARKMLQESDISDEDALGVYACAIRETFEESGVLLADGPGNEPVTVSDSYREKLMRSDISLVEMAEKLKLRLRFSALLPYARWITPAIEAKRFDTRFFIINMPAAQHATHDNHEMVAGLWVTPDEALEKQRAGEISLMPPTLKIIMELSGFNAAEEVIEHTRKKKILPIQPQPFMDGDIYGVLLPWDKDYDPDGDTHSTDVDDVSRIFMKDGCWQVA